MNIDILPYGVEIQSQLDKEDKDYFVLYGGRGSGKSFTIAKLIIAMIINKPQRVLVVRYTNRSLQGSVYRLILDVIQEVGAKKLFKVKTDAIECVNGSTIDFRGIQAHNAGEIQSFQGATICWAEEAQFLPRSVWEALIATIRASGCKMFISFNPRYRADYVYETFVENKHPNAVVKFVNYDKNPLLSKKSRRDIVYDKSVDHDKYLHIWEGQLLQHSDALVFNRKFVVEEFNPPSPSERLYFGADWGFGPDPTCAVSCFVRGNNLHIWQEVYAVGLKLEEVGALFNTLKRVAKGTIYADSSQPQTIDFVARNGALRIVKAKKWNGSVEDGLVFMRSFENIVIHPSCRRSAAEFGLYKYKEDKSTGEILPITIDKHNHCIDAVRYAIGDLILKRTSLLDVL